MEKCPDGYEPDYAVGTCILSDLCPPYKYLNPDNDNCDSCDPICFKCSGPSSLEC